MGEERYSFERLLQFLEDSIATFPDVRTGKNTVYEVRDAVLSAFSVFFMQCPSFLSHQGVICELVTSEGLLLIALDGTWFFSSEQIMCPSCQSKRHKNGFPSSQARSFTRKLTGIGRARSTNYTVIATATGCRCLPRSC